MLTETELKLQLPAATLAAIPDHPLVQARLQGGWQRLELFNQYYDTPELALDRAGFALRLRRDGDCIIQTLKGRGSSRAGLSVRQEWDWYLAQAELSLEHLREPGLPRVLADLDLSTLQPLFRTDFQRQKGCLCWHYRGEPVELELALDVGEAVSPARRSPIRELELELRQGPEAAVREFALQLAQDLAMLPCDSAKAERGYRLLDPARRTPLPPLPAAQQGAQQLLPALLHCQLAAVLSHGERLLNGCQDALAPMQAALSRLARGQRLQEQLAPDSASLSHTLEQLSAELAPDGCADGARQRLTEDPRWGWLALKLAQSPDAAGKGDSKPALTVEARSELEQLYEEVLHER